ncbi:MAG: SUMF1/EgtB/PvdO family nonheme iron enzyme [Bacteroidales bacterium]|nr:SUMF1/EgtB/PvdO family nonheme iron enzyme [Bacteroidales bacterium]MBQ2573915.1 SUMF1/EgtB/PvdO family nonheme iron enzyme [Bacteroidales bacterium]
MKKLVFALVFVIASTTVFSQFNAKIIEKKLYKMSENLYVSKCYVSNKQYADFISYLEEKGEKSKLKYCLLDTAQWGEPMSTLYHAHPVYFECPVVTMSYEGAVEYCKWLTEKYNNSHKKKFANVEFRLPTKDELENYSKQSGNAGKNWSGKISDSEQPYYMISELTGEKSIVGENYTHKKIEKCPSTVVGFRVVAIIK